MDDVVRIPFTREANGYKFFDTLVLPADHTFSEQTINEMQNERFASWISHMHDRDGE